MTFPGGRRAMTAVIALAVLAVAAITWTVWPSEPPPRGQDLTIDVLDGPANDQRVTIDATFFAPASGGKAPAILLGHGFGGSKSSVRDQAQRLAQHGYAVLTWSARGFGRSTGEIALNSPDYEVKDVQQLVDWLATRPEVRLDAAGDPRVGMAGGSYGGAIALMTAAYDTRIDAIAPQITWHDLADALFPNATGQGPATGVFKKMWAGIFFSAGGNRLAGLSGGASGGLAGLTGGTGTGGSGGAGGLGGTSTGGTGTPGTGPSGASTSGASTPGAGTSGAGAGETGTGAGSTGASPAPTNAPDISGTPETSGSERPTATGMTPQQVQCGRFMPTICDIYQEIAEKGQATPQAIDLLRRSSPVSVPGKIRIPSLIIQGQRDSLFPLSHADANARAIAATGAPVEVAWINGGHDGGDGEGDWVFDRTAAWFDTWLKNSAAPGNPAAAAFQKATGLGAAGQNTAGQTGADPTSQSADQAADKSAATAVPGGAAFTVSRDGGRDPGTRRNTIVHAEGTRYSGLSGTAQTAVTLTGPTQVVANPPGGSPAAISSIPGFGSLLGNSSTGVSAALDLPGQSATFESAPLRSPLHLTGSPTATIRVYGTGQVTLFAKLYDATTGQLAVLPGNLTAPLRVNATPSGTTATIALPAVDRRFDTGRTLRLVLATTDMAYATPATPAVYQVELASPDLVIPTDGELSAPATGPAWWTWAMPLSALVVAVVLVLVGRVRRADTTQDPELADVPLQITGLTKRYRNGEKAVDDLSFRVERGQVLGLLGPNGAGKTTTMRMLMGLIHPDAGEIKIFGSKVVPGAPVLSRLGSFVEGPGFLPHLSGRDNLELYWRATGRPAADAHLDEALEIAGLGNAVDRAVRTYSQGMRQRLAIAQAMLGLPDLLVLDEPTNGLDPPQIAEMRKVLRSYAAKDRTVIVSSHLLGEVEQTCSHVVVMHRGRLISDGPVAELLSRGHLNGSTRLEDVFLDLIGEQV
ncbi:alpha/beta fold hydrolase [Acrocarpospora sp. B8E8]|uniref:alpha/beta fold hydrolase n=1 Tax=Acrocarpospora sp. B8E8 TaxID=3153572 RepID=UPI00325E17FF